jgi:hypothetical protein
VFFYLSLTRQILYMDAFHLTMGSHELLDQHVKACLEFLRRNYSESKLVFCVENLPGNRGGEMAYQLRNVSGCLVMNEFGQDKRPGVPKTRAITVTMGMRARRLLLTDGVHFAARMGTFPADTPEENSAAVIATQKQLVEQIIAFIIDDHGRWTGKNGATGLDDLAVSWMMCYYWYEVFTESDEYLAFRSRL